MSVKRVTRHGLYFGSAALQQQARARGQEEQALHARWETRIETV